MMDFEVAGDLTDIALRIIIYVRLELKSIDFFKPERIYP